MEYIIIGILFVLAVIGFGAAVTVFVIVEKPQAPKPFPVRWKCDHCYASCRHMYDDSRPVRLFDEICLTHSILAPDCEKLYGATQIRLYNKQKRKR